MQTRTIRRASLTALVCAALAGPALAQHGPGAPGHSGEGPRFEHADWRGHGPGHRHGHRHWGHHRGGSMAQLLGLVPLRPGMEFRMVDGRLAFMRAELKITDVQAQAWDAFAAAIRENAAKLADAYKRPDREAREKMTPADRIGWIEAALAARLDAVKRAKAAIGPLYAALSDDQKKLFDRFVPTRVMGDRQGRRWDRGERRGPRGEGRRDRDRDGGRDRDRDGGRDQDDDDRD